MNDPSDEVLRDALASGGQFDPMLGESLIGEARGAFQAQAGWVRAVTWAYAAGAGGLAVGAATWFFVGGHYHGGHGILWATLFVVACVWVGLIKTWLWIAGARFAILTAVKRLEARLAALEDRPGRTAP